MWWISFRQLHFYPRPPRGGRQKVDLWQNPQFDFYPRPPRGGRLLSGSCFPSPGNFYPRPPRGGRPEARRLEVMEDELFLSTPSARRATAVGLAHPQPRILISIHALREEGDVMTTNIREWRHFLFLSTPSARRATTRRKPPQQNKKDFYPRPPRGGRQQKQRQNLYFQTNYTTFCTNLEEP